MFSTDRKFSFIKDKKKKKTTENQTVTIHGLTFHNALKINSKVYPSWKHPNVQA